MASYSAVIDLRVDGLQGLKQLEDRLNVINTLTKRIKPIPTLFDQRGSQELKEAKNALSDLVEQYGKGNTRVAKFSSSIAGLNSQLQAFKQIAANAKTGSDQFTNSLIAAERASNKLVSAELKRLDVLQQAYTRAGSGGLSAEAQGPSGMVRNVLALKTQVSGSISSLQTYAAELERVFNLVEAGSVDYRTLQKEIAATNRQLDIASGIGPVQGPALPAGFTEAGPRRTRGPASLLSARPGQGLQAPGVMDAILGGAFPALFGAGPGAMLGGAAGGFIGGTMGGLGGMALSIAFSAVGQQIDEAIKRVKELGDAINMVDVDKLRESFVFVNAELEVAITRSIRLGDIESARAQALEAAAQQTGALGTAIEDSSNATALLGNSWSKVSGSVASLLSMLAAPFTAALAGILNLVNLVVVGWNKIFSIVGQALKGTTEFVVKLFGGEQAVAALNNMFKAVNEEQQKANAAAQLKLDLANEDLMIATSLYNIEKQRTVGVTAEQKLQNVDVDLRQKKLQIAQSLWDTERNIREENKGASQELVDALVARAQGEAKVKLQTEELLANRQKEKIILENTLELIKAKATAEINAINNIESRRKQDLSLQQAIISSAQELGAIEQNRLAVQLKYSMSLNQTAAIIDSIAQKRLEQAERDLENAKLQADASVRAAVAESDRADARARAAAADMEALKNQDQLTELKRVELQATIDEAEVASRAVGIAAQIAENRKAGAEARFRDAQVTVDLERSEQQVAAFAEEYARYTKEAVAALEQQQNALTNQANLFQERVNAQLTLNNLEIDSLNNRLKQAATEEQRKGILYEIRDIEIENARLTLEATRAQIAAAVEQQRIALAITQIKVEELNAVVQLARAQNVLTRAHLEALNAAVRARNIAADNYAISQQMAQEQYRVADAVYNAAVNAANLKAQLTEGASAAGSIAGSMERAARAVQGMSSAKAVGVRYDFGPAGENEAFRSAYRKAMNEFLKDQRTMFSSVALTEKKYAELNKKFFDAATEYNRRFWQENRKNAEEAWRKGGGGALPMFAAGGYVSSPTIGMVGEAGPEYIIPSGKMDSAMANYAAGKRGASILSPQVNISTGPVMQMDGTNYVTMNDLQQATSTAARQGANLALSQLQSNPSLRRTIGVNR